MNNVKPTPGPWAIHSLKYADSEAVARIVPQDQHKRACGFSCVDENRNRTYYANVIAEVRRHFEFITPEEMKANARLIAAAPELLSALKECTAALEFFDTAVKGYRHADLVALIAKAECGASEAK